MKINGVTINPGKSITITLGGIPKTFLSDNPLFDRIQSAVKKENWDEVVTLMAPEPIIEKLTSGLWKVIDGNVHVGTNKGTKKLPTELNNTVLTFLSEGSKAFERLVKFGVKLFDNPSEDAIDQLYSYLVKNEFPICEDGDFIAYRKVRNDYKDFHTGKFDNSVGTTVKMNREDVDNDPFTTCSRGLHAANWEYVTKHYYPNEGRIVAMKINPANVVSIPVDYNNAKMRVCEFFVLEDVQEQYSGSKAYKMDSSSEEEKFANICSDGINGCEVLHHNKPVSEIKPKDHVLPAWFEIQSQNNVSLAEEAKIILNEALAFKIGSKQETCFILNAEDYDWFVLNVQTLGKKSIFGVWSMDEFESALRAVRSKKYCPLDIVLDLRVSARNGILTCFNKKKFNKEYRDLLGVS